MNVWKRYKIKEKALFLLLAFFLWLITYTSNKGKLHQENIDLNVRIQTGDRDTVLYKNIQISYRAETVIKNPRLWSVSLSNIEYTEFILSDKVKEQLNDNLKNELTVLSIHPDTLWLGDFKNKEIPLIIAVEMDSTSNEFKIVNESWYPKSVSIKDFPGKNRVNQKLTLGTLQPEIYLKGEIPTEKQFFKSHTVKYEYHAEVKVYTTHHQTYMPEKNTQLDLEITSEVGYIPSVQDIEFKIKKGLGTAMYWSASSEKQEIKTIKILNPWLTGNP
jgi:hypothetical protein